MPRRLTLLGATVILWLVLDQASKQWAFEHLAGQSPRTYGGILTLIYSQNMGAWGSLGASWHPWARWLLLSALPALLLLGLAYHALRDPHPKKSELLAYALIVAGGLGNLLDRFRLGYVRDFLYLGYGPIGTNIFNLADMILMVGLGVLLVRQFRSPA